MDSLATMSRNNIANGLRVDASVLLKFDAATVPTSMPFDPARRLLAAPPQVIQRLDEENLRSRRFLHPSSYAKVTRECEQRLAADHLPFLQAHCRHMVTHEYRHGELVARDRERLSRRRPPALPAGALPPHGDARVQAQWVGRARALESPPTTCPFCRRTAATWWRTSTGTVSWSRATASAWVAADCCFVPVKCDWLCCTSEAWLTVLCCTSEAWLVGVVQGEVWCYTSDVWWCIGDVYCCTRLPVLRGVADLANMLGPIHNGLTVVLYQWSVTDCGVVPVLCGVADLANMFRLLSPIHNGLTVLVDEVQQHIRTVSLDAVQSLKGNNVSTSVGLRIARVVPRFALWLGGRGGRGEWPTGEWPTGE